MRAEEARGGEERGGRFVHASPFSISGSATVSM